MQKGHLLEIACQGCEHTVQFSLFDIDSEQDRIQCSHCQKTYAFTDENLLRQLKKFEALCRQIHESEEILGDTAIGIDVGEHHVQIPFKLLLTRLNSALKLRVGDETINIVFRTEPLTENVGF